MTLTIYNAEDIPQGSDAWLEARRGIVTASTIGQLITAKTLRPAKNDTARGLIETLTAERVTGRVEPVYANAAMERGNRDEPWARHEYEKATGNKVDEVGFIRLDAAEFTIGYSPDGLVGDHGLIEIKSRSPRIQMRTILTDEVPAANMAQIMCGLYVTGREWLDYVSYSNGMPLYIKRVFPDNDWFNAIRCAMNEFTIAADAITDAYEAQTMPMHRTEYIDHDAEEVDIF